MAEANTGALSVEQAIERIAPPQPAEAEVEAQTEETADLPTETEDGDPSEADEPGDEVEAEEQPAAEVVDAPKWWDAEKKAVWATLTPAQQTAVADQEAKREAVVEKAKTETAKERQQYQGVLNALAKSVPSWVAAIDQAEKTFKSNWEGFDWAGSVDQYGSEQTQKWRFQYEEEQAKLAQSRQALAEAKQAEDHHFLATRARELPEMAPELVDPVKGNDRQTELSQWLLKAGAVPERVARMDALEMTLAWKAMKYDKAGTTLQPRVPKPAASGPRVAPAAAPARTTTSHARNVAEAQARLTKSGSIEDAVALLEVKAKGK